MDLTREDGQLGTLGSSPCKFGADVLPLGLAVELVGQVGDAGAAVVEAQSPLNLKDVLAQVVKVAGREDQRLCRVTAPLASAGVLMMCVHRSLSEDEAFRRLRGAPRDVFPVYPAKEPTEEAFYHARERLGVEPLRLFFEQTARVPDRMPTFHGLEPHVIDGTHLSMPATDENIKAFGLHKIPHGHTAYPSMKAVALIAAETHLARGVVLGGLYMGEIKAAKTLIGLLGPQDFLLLDRGLMSLEFAGDMCDADVKFVGRVNGNWKPKIIKENGPGDSEVEITVVRTASSGQPGTTTQAGSICVDKPKKKQKKKEGPRFGKRKKRKKNSTPKTEKPYRLRLVEYLSPAGQTVRLLTNLLDVDEFPTSEIITVFPVRWEVETSFDEIKTHLAAPPKGTPPTILRSKSPDGARQEAFGLFAAFNLIRSVITEAARTFRVRPTDISFTRSLRHIQLFLAVAPYVPAENLRKVYRQLLKAIGASKLRRRRRPRRSPRKVKANRSSFPTKRLHDKTERLGPPTIRVVENRVYVSQEVA